MCLGSSDLFLVTHPGVRFSEDMTGSSSKGSIAINLVTMIKVSFFCVSGLNLKLQTLTKNFSFSRKFTQPFTHKIILHFMISFEAVDFDQINITPRTAPE